MIYLYWWTHPYINAYLGLAYCPNNKLNVIREFELMRTYDNWLDDEYVPAGIFPLIPTK